GDVFLIAGVAMWSSVNSTPWIIGIAAASTMICMSLFPRSNTGAAIPFGPFICASLYIFTFFPGAIFHTGG
ncbi:TPA: prepilin peptidase, partial [Escherichia coli O146]